MPLVSRIYRQASTESWISREESERRLRLKIQRLVNDLGRDEVVTRIRAHPVNQDQAVVKAWLVLSAEASGERHRSGTL